MKVNQLLRISNNTVEFINKFIKPIITPDYIGWSIPLPKKYKTVLIIDYSEDKDWDLLPSNPAKRLKKKTITKALKFLINKGWLTALPNVFEEFSPQLQVDINNAIVLPKENCINIEEIVDSFPGMVYDDNVDDIQVLGDSNDGK